MRRFRTFKSCFSSASARRYLTS